jgi:hypothetical protein
MGGGGVLRVRDLLRASGAGAAIQRPDEHADARADENAHARSYTHADVDRAIANAHAYGPHDRHRWPVSGCGLCDANASRGVYTDPGRGMDADLLGDVPVRSPETRLHPSDLEHPRAARDVSERPRSRDAERGGYGRPSVDADPDAYGDDNAREDMSNLSAPAVNPTEESPCGRRVFFPPDGTR